MAGKPRRRAMASGHYFSDLTILLTNPPQEKNMRSNGWRYPLVGGTRERHFDGTSFKPRKLPENAPTPTSRVHALLGGNVLVRNLFYSSLERSIPKNQIFSAPWPKDSVEPITMISPFEFIIVLVNVSFLSPPKVLDHCKLP